MKEPIGNLAAEALLEFFVNEIGPVLYNQALEATMHVRDHPYPLGRRAFDQKDGVSRPIARRAGGYLSARTKEQENQDDRKLLHGFDTLEFAM